MQFPHYYQQLYAERLSEIKQRLYDFSCVHINDWFYEACYCMLTPQSKAIHALKVCTLLKDQDFWESGIETNSLLGNPKHYIRFHNQKSRNLQELRNHFTSIRLTVEAQRDFPFLLRDSLTKNIRGFGLKESAHFMRNIGIFGPAILDRHILKHLAVCNIIEAGTTIKSSKHYYEIEGLWFKYCSEVSVPMEEMDLLFWSIETGIILK